MMRVVLSGMECGELEGELIKGRFLNSDSGEFCLDEIFEVQLDDGTVVEVHGWLLDSIVGAHPPRLEM